MHKMQKNMKQQQRKRLFFGQLNLNLTRNEISQNGWILQSWPLITWTF